MQGIANKAKAKLSKKQIEPMIWQAVSALSCALCALMPMKAAVSPLMLCVFAAVVRNGSNLPLSMASLLLGRVINYAIVSDAFLGADVLAVLLLSGMLYARQTWGKALGAWVEGLLIAIVLFFSRILMQKMLGYDYLVLGVQLVAVLILSGTMQTAAKVLYSAKRRRVLSQEEILSLCLFACIILSALAPARIWGVSLASVLTFYVVMALSYASGPAVGAACGAAAGVALSIGFAGRYELMGNLAMCGLAAGMFRKMGRGVSGLSFLLVNAMLTLMINGSNTVLMPLAETLPAWGMLLLTPRKWMDRLSGAADKGARKRVQSQILVERVQEMAAGKVAELGGMFRTMSDAFKSVACADEGPANAQVAAMMRTVSQRVCGGCALHGCCWQREYDQTFAWLQEAMENARIDGHFDAKKIDPTFARRCMRLNDLAVTVDDALYLYTLKQQWEGRIDDSRLLVAEQLEGVSGVVRSLADEIKVDVEMDGEMEREIRVEFDKAGIYASDDIVAYKGPDGWQVQVSLRACDGGEMPCKRAGALAVSKALATPMMLQDYQCDTAEDGLCRCTYAPKVRFEVEVGAADKKKERISGDHYIYEKLSDQRVLVALSDGMGSGERACAESRATVSLLAQFMKAGFDKEVMMRAINRLLILRSGEEMFATVDMCLFDLTQGVMEMTKIGAAPGYVIAGGQVEKAPSDTLPIGIVDDVRSATTLWQLSEGDGVVILSDGVTDVIGEDVMTELLELLWPQAKGDAQALADMVLETAMQCSGETVKDDMSVLVGWMRKAG
ncbi:MAG: stage II sporulation protein E [Christensenellales bacterium]